MSSDEEDTDCPLCMEELDIADRNFRPCPCGYQICRFCWHHIKTNLNGRCPACRRLYSEQIVEFIPVSAEEIMRLKKEKKEKDRQARELRDPSRRQLSNVRVVQKNLVYVLGLSSKYASAENEFFRKYGRIDKVVISKRATAHSGSTVGIYVTYTRKDDASRAIEGINGAEVDGRTVRASYGTTKYCTYYLRNMPCPNPNCMYLHEPGEDIDSYNKDTVTIGKHANTAASATSNSAAHPNKRAAITAKVPGTSGATPAGSTSTSEHKPSAPPRAWAPIPKVTPVPPIVDVPTAIAASSDKEEEPEVSTSVLPDRPASPPFIEVGATKNTITKSNKPASTVSSSSSAPTAIHKKPLLEKSNGHHHTNNTKKTTPVPLPLADDDKPALPATASWASSANQQQQQRESVITPANFGPSLSDALQAPQKPKHTPALKVKKEKKTKSKMVRLEEFEEAKREAKMAKTQNKQQPIDREASKVQNDNAADQVNLQSITRQANGSQVNDATNKLAGSEVERYTAVVSNSDTKDNSETPDADVGMVGMTHNEAHPENKEDSIVKEDSLENTDTIEIDVSKETTKETAPVGSKEVTIEDQNMSNILENAAIPEMVEVKNKQNEISEPDTDATVEHEVKENEAVENQTISTPENIENIEDITALNNTILKALDTTVSEGIAEQSQPIETTENGEKAHIGQSEMITDEEQLQPEQQPSLSPLVAMDRLSALVEQEVMKDTLKHQPLDLMDAQEENLQIVYNNAPSSDEFYSNGMMMQQPMQKQQQGMHPMPPPGLGGPLPPRPEWLSRPNNSSFDPFNGQDPAVIAARRLQHSQRMLEASGLFAGPGAFGQPPPPPPQFGFPNTFLQRQPHPPPPPPHHSMGMFPPHQPHPMMRPPPPDLMNLAPFGLPPQLQHMQQLHQQSQKQMPSPQQPLDELRNNFGAMSLNGDSQERQQQQPHQPHQQSRDDLRALLPNVNISFNNLEEKRRMEQLQQQNLLFDNDRIPNINDNNSSIQAFSPLSQPLSSIHSPHSHHDKILLKSPMQSQQYPSPAQQPFLINNEQQQRNKDVRVEAQNFFGEFLRRAASSSNGTNAQELASPKIAEGQTPVTEPSLPFQDPAIMSVRVVNNDMPNNNSNTDVARSQNTMLQILGGQAPPQPQPPSSSMMSTEQQQQRTQQHMPPSFTPAPPQQQAERQMDPRFMMEQKQLQLLQQQAHNQQHQPLNNGEHMGMMNNNNNVIFMGHPSQHPSFQHQQDQQRQPQQQQQQLPFGHRQGHPPPPFMGGPHPPHPMGMMGHMPPPPPGMMRPPLHPAMGDLRFGPIGAQFPPQPPPPGMFAGMNHPQQEGPQ